MRKEDCDHDPIHEVRRQASRFKAVTADECTLRRLLSKYGGDVSDSTIQALSDAKQEAAHTLFGFIRQAESSGVNYKAEILDQIISARANERQFNHECS